MLKLLLFTSLLIIHSHAFSIPSSSLKPYGKFETFTIFANEVDSRKTLLNYKYYDLNLCREKESHLNNVNENLGSNLLGETTQIAPYDLQNGIGRGCVFLCGRDFSEEDVKFFKELIDREYRMNFVIDNLPALLKEDDKATVGIPLGYKKDGKYYINNHVKFRVEHSKSLERDKELDRIIGFSIIPESVPPRELEGKPWGYCQEPKGKGEKIGDVQELKAGPIFFSYDVKFNRTERTLDSRFPDYKFLGDEKIHLSSLGASFVGIVILFLTVGQIFSKTRGKANQVSDGIRINEEPWKKLSRDVFRPPEDPLILSALIGTGLQILAVAFLTLAAICLEVIDHTRRGTILTTIIILSPIMTFFAGFTSARIFKMFQGEDGLRCALVTAFLVPGINFALLFIINLVFLSKSSSNAFNIFTLLALVAIWFAVSIPLVLFGSIVGHKEHVMQNPRRINPVPTPINPMPVYVQSLSLLGGLLPFGAIFIELKFVLTSIWEHSLYYFNSYLFVALIFLVINTALVSIIITYLNLNNGNHKIGWTSFFSTGSVGIYVFVYAVFHLGKLGLMGFSSIFIYFGYMLALSLLFAVLCGAIGFMASYWFARTIYSASVHID